MKNQLYTLLSGILLSIYSFTTVAQNTEILFSHPEITGISNAVVFNNEIHFVVGMDPQAGFPGYPDPSAKFEKLILRNETGEVFPYESEAVAAGPAHADLQLTPEGNLAFVYQAPSGTSYGFRMPYKVWDGQALLTDELVFPNANWGAWGRIGYDNNDVPHVLSFAHAGYALFEHTRPDGNWSSSQITGYSTSVGNLSLASSNGYFYLLGSYVSASPYQARLYSDESGSWEYEVIDTDIDRTSDIAFSNDGILHALYNTAEGSLKLAKKANGVWESEIVWMEEGITSRASLFFDEANTPYIAFQTADLLKVIQYDGMEWVEVYRHEGLTSPGGAFHPTLLVQGDQLIVIYNDENNVYKGTVGPITSTQAVKQGPAFAIYPNPARDRITVELAASSPSMAFRIVDASGREVSRLAIEDSSNRRVLDISALPAGLYWVLPDKGMSFRPGKFVKME
ncbi:MAG: T9SS type A sorting domain-containing protein [Lewinellaceae bacterium]|nr:T9SS type A sorting domain-containing protein [Lewinellaceae bacterium]